MMLDKVRSGEYTDDIIVNKGVLLISRASFCVEGRFCHAAGGGCKIAV